MLAEPALLAQMQSTLAMLAVEKLLGMLLI
jgi:hypothetical protein